MHFEHRHHYIFDGAMNVEFEEFQQKHSRKKKSFSIEEIKEKSSKIIALEQHMYVCPYKQTNEHMLNHSNQSKNKRGKKTEKINDAELECI